MKTKFRGKRAVRNEITANHKERKEEASYLADKVARKKKINNAGIDIMYLLSLLYVAE